MNPVLSLTDVRFAWPECTQLINIDALELTAGDHLFIQGPSGSGKSTLLNLLGGFLAGYQGQIQVAGQVMTELSRRQLDQLRADRLGILFQQFNLLPYLDLIENVSLPCRFSKARSENAKARSGSVHQEAERLLQRLGLDVLALGKRPITQLSIGQQQRVAAARALIGSPSLIIADEPTSALDPHHRDLFIELLLEESAQCGSSLVLVSHDPALAPFFSHHLSLEAQP